MKKSSSLRNFWYSLSPNQRSTIRKWYYLPADIWDDISGKRHKYVPPRGKIYTGSPANAKKYVEQGQQQVALLKEHINLQPQDNVLDIGSGIGRTAIALTSFLNSKGSYEGFDVVAMGIDWCNSKIKKDFPNFNFTYVPLFNDLYNTATLKATEFVFPYADATFDKIFSFSVFTHMQTEEIQHYLGEIARVLKPEGSCFSTFFLYNDATEQHIATQEPFHFPVKKDGYRLMNETVTSGNIALHEDLLQTMLAEKRLTLTTLEDGFWKGTAAKGTPKEYQDIVVIKKMPSA